MRQRTRGLRPLADAGGGRIRVGAVLAGVAAAALGSVLAAGVIAMVLYSTTLTEAAASQWLFVAGVLALTAAAALGARMAGGLGWLHGLLIGGLYAAGSVALTPLLFPGGLTWLSALQRLVLALLVGTLGGVLGVNL